MMINNKMMKRIVMMGVLMFGLFFVGASQMAAQSRIFPLYLQNGTDEPVNLKITWADRCYEGSPGVNAVIGPIAPGNKGVITIARVQGHGCDGENAIFCIQSTNPRHFDKDSPQCMTFSNDGQLWLSNFWSKKYRSTLSAKSGSSDQSYTMTIGENIPIDPATTIDYNPASPSNYNVALGKPTSQSSTFTNANFPTARKAVDGKIDGNFENGSVSSTDLQDQPYWEVDLEEIYSLTQIDIYNRTDCCRERLTNFKLFTSTDRKNWTTFHVPGTVDSHHGILINAPARYVQIRLSGKGFLSLAEVMVYTNVPPLVTKFAPMLGYDKGAGANGYPMSAQTFRDKIDILNRNATKDGQKGGFIADGTTPNEMHVQNFDKNTLTNGTAPTYFTYREVGPKKQVRIMYWWFYGFQPQCIVGGGGSHHGDWEKIMVTLNEARTAVAAVTFYQHNNSYTRIAGPRDAPCTPAGTGRCRGASGFESQGTHVKAYVERNSHGSFHDANTGGPGGCGYWEGFRDPDTWFSAGNKLINLDGASEPWIAEDKTATWAWGNDGISTHPTQGYYSISANMPACEGSATWLVKSSGCYKSECLAGDDQAAGNCLKECQPGYNNVGLTCNKGVLPWEWKIYGRLTGGNMYGYDYPIPLGDSGLSRRRAAGEPW